MDSRDCLGVHCYHKNGTFYKLHQTPQKFQFKAQNGALNFNGKRLKTTIFSQKLSFFILRIHLELIGDKKMKHHFF